jgi:NADPH-dependent 2,4-dienoyl-CoA reductase/sulfur reductase-like enzyme
MTTRLLIIGGSDAGISAGLRARELDPRCEVTIVVADRFPNYSICGLPFYLSGEVPDWHWLAHRTAEDIAREGIHLLLDSTAQAIDPANHLVTILDEAGKTRQLPYDRLVIATGAVPVRPRIPGIDLSGVYLLRSMQDSFAVHEYLDTHAPPSAVIVGGGYIGMEMADAFVQRGLAVTVVEHGASVLKTVDESLGKQVLAELQHHGVEVATVVAVERIAQVGAQLRVMGSEGFSVTADLVLVAVSVRPQTELAEAAGIATGERHVIRVTRTMETNVSDIYAAGDCVETWHRLLKAPTYLPLGTTAHKQGPSPARMRLVATGNSPARSEPRWSRYLWRWSPARDCARTKQRRQGSIRSRSKRQPGTTKSTTLAHTKPTSDLPETGRRAASWERKWSGTTSQKLPNGLTSLPLPCFTGCA